MKISVIIPTYKPKDYLWECLDSLKSQTISKLDFEVILVLNGCCEPWKFYIEQYIANNMQGMNINFIQIDQGGVSNARNTAIDMAVGDYITFIDDDDIISSSFLEELYGKASPEVVSLSYPYAFNDGDFSTQLDYRITNEFLSRSKYGKQLFIKTRKIFSGPCMKLFHHSILKGRYFDLHFKNGEDSLYMFLISDRLKYVDYTSNKAIYYRRFRENSAVTTRRSKMSKIINGISLIKSYTKIYLCSPGKYSFNFYLTRVLGTIKGMLC